MSAPWAIRSVLRQGKRIAVKGLTRSTLPVRQQAPKITSVPLIASAPGSARYFTATVPRTAGIMPETADPQSPSIETSDHKVQQPTEISDAEYHQHADHFMEALLEEAEKIQESREDVEVEYSAGVLSLNFPPNGSYVINKQPVNKQIWLSSPKSGPKRYDWVVAGEAMHQKEGGGVGDWVYLRDHSTLNDVLGKEIGIWVDKHGDADALQTSGKDPTS